MLSDHCLFDLSVTVYCGQMVGRIKINLGIQVGLGFLHIALDGDPAPVPPKGHSPPFFGRYMLWPNGWLDQDATGREVSLSPSDILLDRDPAPPAHKGGRAPYFSAHFYCGQMAGCIKMSLGM